MSIKKRMRSGAGLLQFAALSVMAIAVAAVTLFATKTPVDPALAARVNTTAIVEVVTVPQLCGGEKFRFTGTPSGEITLATCESVPAQKNLLSTANLEPGIRESTLSYIDTKVTDMGYRLTAIRCDDRKSATVSSGNIGTGKATFRNDADETVTCRFFFATAPESTCVCPSEGKWNVNNHPGKMVCTGQFPMAMPLAPAKTVGTIIAQDNCATLFAEGMTDDEAPITFRRTPQCEYRGSVGGEKGGIPMVINFTLVVEDEDRLTGALSSAVSQKGVTCKMDRTYELDLLGEK